MEFGLNHASYGSFRANVMSSTKPRKSVTYCIVIKGQSHWHMQLTRIENFAKTRLYGLCERTDRQTFTFVAILLRFAVTSDLLFENTRH